MSTPSQPEEAALGPFDPPDDFAFEEEFEPPVPRPIPAYLRKGRYGNARRRAIWGAFCCGAVCLSSAEIPVVRMMGLYFLPLQYLQWIGLALFAIGGYATLDWLIRKGPFRYVREGIPTPARIRGLVKTVTAMHNGQPSAYAFVAAIDVVDPDTDAIQTVAIQSPGMTGFNHDKLTTSFRVGDYVTAVYLPRKPAKSMRLYGFLDLRPGLGLVRIDGKKDTGPLQVVAVMLVVAAFLAPLLLCLYAFGRYQPIAEFDSSQWAVGGVGAVCVGGVFAGLLAMGVRRGRSRRDERNLKALAEGRPVEIAPPPRRFGWFGEHGIVLGLLIVAGCVLMGGVMSLCIAWSVNALADGSPPEMRPARAVGMTQTTHNVIFRTYEIAYTFQNDPLGKVHKRMSTPFEMIPLFNRASAVAEVHAGALGWPWVKAIHPR